nr:hypothetical protein CFP56_38005 [Quercus suber]
METFVHTREEDDELQRSTKKVKFPTLNPHSDDVETGGLSYKESLLGEIPGAFEQAFVVDSPMDFEALSDDEFENLPPGEVAVKLSGDRKNKIRASWANALIMKVFGKTVGFHFLQSPLTSMWKPSGRMSCIDLGNDFFLIKFLLKEDHAKVNFEKPIVKIVKVGGIDQSVQYEGISSLCFACGCVRHKVECCPYNVKQLDKIVSSESGVKQSACQSPVEESDLEEKAFGPCDLVARKGKPRRQMIKEVRPEANFGSPFQSPIKPFNSLSSQIEPFPANGTSLNNKAGSSAIGADRTTAFAEKTKTFSKPTKGKGLVCG